MENTIEKSPERLEILKKIDELEKKQKWTEDVEEDPPTIPLTPDMVDYGNQKLWSKIKTKTINIIARKFINKLIKNKLLIIKDVKGLDTFIKMKDQGAIITCNHFNPFDNFAVYKSVEKYIKHKELWKVCREGNYTNFPGLFGVFFRNCNTLPLSSNFSCMKLFMKACETLLKNNEKILIYAEQGMWWNYRKPRPCANGAFKIAAQNNVPVIPFFITMTDSDSIGPDGFPIQEYTINILEPIYPDKEKSVKENMNFMNEQNYKEWKDCYEIFYGIPLTYLQPE